MIAAARTVVVLGIALQFAGFGKLLLIADYFGAGPLLDAYYLGLVVPTYIASISAGILQSSFLPSYIEARAQGNTVAAARIRKSALTWTVTLLACACAVVAVLPKSQLAALLHASTPEVREHLAAAFVLLLWTTPVSGFAEASGILLNAEGRFLAASSAPVANVLVGLAVLYLWPDRGIDALAWSLMLGLLAQAAVVTGALWRAGLRPGISFALPVNVPRALTAIALPVFLSSALTNFVPAYLQVQAARVGPGSVSAMGYASRLHNSLVQAVVLSVSIVLLPHFARLLAESRHEELRRTLERVFAATVLFAGSAAVLVATGGPTAIRLLLAHGRFTSQDAQLVAQVWLALTFGLLGATWGTFLARVFQARRRPAVIAVLAVVLVAANIAFCTLLLPRFGVIGVAMANSAAYLAVALITQRLSGSSWRGPLTALLLPFIARAIAANAVAFVVNRALSGLAAQSSPLFLLAGQVVVVTLANLLVARTAPLGLTLRTVFGR